VRTLAFTLALALAALALWGLDRIAGHAAAAHPAVAGGGQPSLTATVGGADRTVQ